MEEKITRKRRFSMPTPQVSQPQDLKPESARLADVVSQFLVEEVHKFVEALIEETRDEIDKGAKETEAEQQKQRKPSHVRALDALKAWNIHSGQAIQQIVKAIQFVAFESGQRTPDILLELQRAWKEYKSKMFYHNSRALQKTAAESDGYYEEFMNRLTFGNVFDNDMWRVASREVRREDFAVLDADVTQQSLETLSRGSSFEFKRPFASTAVVPDRNIASTNALIRDRNSEIVDATTKMYSSQIAEYAPKLAAYCDSQARYYLFETFTQALDIWLVKTRSVIRDSTVEYEKDLAVVPNLPTLEAESNLQKAVKLQIDQWRKEITLEPDEDEIPHEQVEQVLVTIETTAENRINQFSVIFGDLKVNAAYEAKMEQWIDIETKLARCRQLYTDLLNLRNSAAVMQQTYSKATCLVTDTNSHKRHKTDAKDAKQTMTLDGIVEELSKQMKELEGHIADCKKALELEAWQDELHMPRAKRLKAAYELDMAAWTQMFLQAVGASHRVSVTQPGLLRKRVEMIVKEMKATTQHAYISDIRKREAEIIKQRTEALKENLHEMQHVLGTEVSALYTQMGNNYNTQLTHFSAAVDRSVFDSHPTFLSKEVVSKGRTLEERLFMNRVVLEYTGSKYLTTTDKVELMMPQEQRTQLLVMPEADLKSVPDFEALTQALQVYLTLTQWHQLIVQ